MYLDLRVGFGGRSRTTFDGTRMRAEPFFEGRWPQGFVCSGCDNGRAWLPKTEAFNYECTERGHEIAVTAGTIMHAGRLELMISCGRRFDGEALQPHLYIAAAEPT
jgi:hypothetical protein